MDRIHYAGDSILTGTDIAKALLSYADALARAEDSATIDVPTRLADGTAGRSTFLLGPASQLVSDFEPSELDEVVDAELVSRLTRESDRIVQRTTTATPVATSDPVVGPETWIEEL